MSLQSALTDEIFLQPRPELMHFDQQLCAFADQRAITREIKGLCHDLAVTLGQRQLFRVIAQGSEQGLDVRDSPPNLFNERERLG